MRNITKKILNKVKNIYLDKKYRLLSKTQKELFKKDISEIQEYRKKIKIYDAFNFFNELETLDIRLNVLNDYVDHFVIIESRLTHSGLPKELFYENNKHLFKKFENKIIHYVIENPLESFEDARERLNNPETENLEKRILKDALHSDNIPEGGVPYLRDFYEKESVKKALVNLKDDDFCFVSDLDEIWNPEILIDYRKNDIYKFRQAVYCYFLNNRTNQKWTGTIATKYKNIKNNCLNHLRTTRKTKYIYVKNGGWHFTYQGGAERVKNKIESYSYYEINTSGTKDNIKEKIESDVDIVGRKFKFWIDEKNLPKYLRENKEKYKELFK